MAVIMPFQVGKTGNQFVNNELVSVDVDCQQEYRYNGMYKASKSMYGLPNIEFKRLLVYLKVTSSLEPLLCLFMFSRVYQW